MTVEQLTQKFNDLVGYCAQRDRHLTNEILELRDLIDRLDTRMVELELSLHEGVKISACLTSVPCGNP